MYNVAQLFKDAREDRGFTIEEVSKKTRIPQRYLQAFETEGNTSHPPEPYCSLYVRNYAIFLGLNGDNILALFRRDYATIYNPKSTFFEENSFINPQRFFKLAIILVTAIFAIYLIIQYQQFNRPPEFSISWPTSPTSLESAVITGKTSSETTIRINQDLIIVDKDGNFTKQITLSFGENPITVEAGARNGKTKKETKTIQRE